MFNDIIDTLIEQLEDVPSLEDIVFINAFDSDISDMPLTSSTVCLSFEGIDINGCAINDYLGEGTSGDYFGKQGIFTIGFDIFAPHSLSGAECCDIYSNIANAILFTQTVFKPISTSCSKVCFDNTTRCFKLGATVNFKLCISKTETNVKINNIILRGEYK